MDGLDNHHDSEQLNQSYSMSRRLRKRESLRARDFVTPISAVATAAAVAVVTGASIRVVGLLSLYVFSCLLVGLAQQALP